MSKELQKLQTELSAGSIGSYIHWVNQIPLLTKEEEVELAERLHKTGDLEAARKLVLAHLRFVVKIARGYNGYGLPMADLIQEGNIGLMKAVKRFDPEKKVRLVSFAVHWIRAEMHEFILRNWRIVKVATTKAQRKLFFKLRQASSKVGWLSDDEAQMVADELQVSKKDVEQMQLRMRGTDNSFSALDNDDENANAPELYLADNRYNPADAVENQDWEENQENGLYAALDNLDERSQDIVRARWLQDDKKTLHDLADKYGVSAERIRQLEQNAFKKLKGALVPA